LKPAAQERKIIITVCVGSSCHLKGAREVIARFSEVVAERGWQGTVELKGCFCMEHCGEGINWEINGQLISSGGVAEAVETLQERVQEMLGEARPA